MVSKLIIDTKPIDIENQKFKLQCKRERNENEEQDFQTRNCTEDFLYGYIDINVCIEETKDLCLGSAAAPLLITSSGNN